MDRESVMMTETSQHVIAPSTDGNISTTDCTTLNNEKKDQGKDNSTQRKMSTSAVICDKAKYMCRKCCTIHMLKKKLPILQWLPSYRCREFQSDLIAGLTVGLTVIPQGLAYAVVAGLPPQYGLYSAFMGCFIYMFLGTSKDITLGPTAIMSLMVGSFAKGKVPGDPTPALVLTLICGLVQFAMGILNLGILVNYISHSVINAFTSAAAITIGFGQVKSILGLKKISSDFLPMVYETFAKIPETNVWDLLMGSVSMILLFLLMKLRTIKWGDEDDAEVQIPVYIRIARKIIWLTGIGANAIVVISAAGITAALMANGIEVISITGYIESGLPPFHPPYFSSPNMTTSEVFESVGAGFIIVPLLGIVEAMAIGKAFARVNKYRIDPTQELVAIGVANIVSSFVSSYPVTGSFSRTAVNSQSGVRTPAGGLFTGALILLCLEVLVQYCYYIPSSALAAVIIMAVIQMIDYKIIPILWRTNKWDLFVHLVTFFCSFIVGIEYGILIGIGLSLLLLLYPMSRPQLHTLFRADAVIVTPDQGLYFPAAEYVEDKIMGMADSEEKTRAVIFDMTHIYGVDYTAIEGFKSLLSDAKLKGIRIIFCNIKQRVLDDILKGNIPDLKTFSTLDEALEELSIQAQTSDEEEPFICRF